MIDGESLGLEFFAGWEQFCQEAGLLLAAAMSSEAPVGESGALAASITFDTPDNDTLSVVSKDPRGPIAAYVIRGTRPHPIDPVNALALHWIGPFGDVFAQHVDHPGTSPNEFNVRAWEHSKDDVLRLYRDRVGHGALAVLNPWRNRTINI